MPLLIYTYDADALPSLLEETADAEEAVAICRALVEEDGYPRAEVWDEEGDRLYAVIRAGEAVLTIGSAADVSAHAPPPPRASADRGRIPAVPMADAALLPPLALPGATDQVRDLELVAAELADPRAARAARDGTGTITVAPAEPEPPMPGNLLGDRPGHAELWFGL